MKLKNILPLTQNEILFGWKGVVTYRIFRGLSYVAIGALLTIGHIGALMLLRAFFA